MTPQALFLAALMSRGFFLLFYTLSDYLLLDYDTSTPVLLQTTSDDNRTSIGFPYHWDSVMFRDVAANDLNYRYIHYHAFLPGFPAIIKYVLHHNTVLIVLWNVVAYAASVVIMHEIGKSLHVPHNRVATLLFAVSPSGVFSCSSYCDPTFAVLSLSGLWLFIQGVKRRVILPLVGSIACLCAATSVRSNGLLNAGLYVFAAICVRQRQSWRWKYPTLMVGVLATVAPFYIYQYWAYHNSCHGSRFSSSPPSHECAGGVSFYSFYSRIQLLHWNVGFLRQYELKQIPNFVIAIPTAFVATAGFVRKYPTPHKTLLKYMTTSTSSSSDESERLVFCLYVQMLAMVVIAALVMHVQVMARFMFSTPALYWCGAGLCEQSNHSSSSSGSRYTRWVLVSYIVVWNIAGGIMFPNFYPWT